MYETLDMFANSFLIKKFDKHWVIITSIITFKKVEKSKLIHMKNQITLGYRIRIFLLFQGLKFQFCHTHPLQKIRLILLYDVYPDKIAILAKRKRLIV